MAHTTETKFKESTLSINIHGMISAVEQIRSERGDFYANTVTIPAKDTMHSPKRVVIYSRLPMGREESIVETEAFISSTFQNRNGKWFNKITLWNEPSNR